MLKRSFAVTAATAIAMLGSGAVAGEYRVCPDEISLAYTGKFRPFQYQTSGGKIKGFDIDIARALCDEIGMQCNFKQIAWTALIPAMEAKKADAAIASMAATETRDERVDFTNKYYKPTGHFIGHRDIEFELSKNVLDNYIIGAERGTTHVRFIKDRFGDGVEVKTYNNQEDLNLDLLSGRIDLMIADTIMTHHSLLDTDRGESFELKGPELTDPKYYAGSAITLPEQGSGKLRRCFNKAISAIRKNGTYDEISKKHFGRNIYNGWGG